MRDKVQCICHIPDACAGLLATRCTRAKLMRAVHLMLADRDSVKLWQCAHWRVSSTQTEVMQCSQDACCMPAAGSRLGQGVRSLYLLLADLGASQAMA